MQSLFNTTVRKNVKNILLFALVFSGISQAGSLTKIRESALRFPEAMSTVKLLHNQDRFLVSDDKGLHEIENCWLDSDLRKLVKNPTALEKFQECGYISVDQCSDGQYILKSHVRGLGGGPTLGVTVYFAVKGGLWTMVGATALGSTLIATSVAAPAIVPAATGAALASSTTLGIMTIFTEGLMTAAVPLAIAIDGIAVIAGVACGMAPTP